MIQFNTNHLLGTITSMLSSLPLRSQLKRIYFHLGTLYSRALCPCGRLHSYACIRAQNCNL